MPSIDDIDVWEKASNDLFILVLSVSIKIFLGVRGFGKISFKIFWLEVFLSDLLIDKFEFIVWFCLVEGILSNKLL